MTTQAHCDFAYRQAKHFFGESVAIVLRTLYNYDQASLKVLRRELSDIKIVELRKALLILVKYQLVDYVKSSKNHNQQFEYSVTPQRIPCFFRINKYIEMLTKCDGQLASDMVRVLARKALLSREKLFATIKSSNIASKQEELDASLNKLIDKRYIVQTSNNLCINLERLEREYRNNLMAEALQNYYNDDPKVSLLAKEILAISLDNTSDDAVATAPVPFQEISKSLIPKVFKNTNSLEKYLLKLTKEKNNGFFFSSGTHPHKGPMYALNIGLLIDYLVKEHLCTVITTRFGPKCCRVFRVLLQRGPLLLKQIEEIIMLPARDVREYSYMLIKEGLIRNRQVPKTPDNAPGKSIFIMAVDLDQVVYSFADLCCRSISNLMTRYDYEQRHHESLLTRSKAVQELIQSEVAMNDDAGSAEDGWNQYFTSHELGQLRLVNRNLNKIILAKIQVDDTLMLLHTWLQIRPNMSEGN